ncbi:hypothetical protein [uncultured Rhodospira sp.]|uniref:hypothetical protein n=1 Tax=uncultured Rhodospira sp. TaxID=1936189 RepID=UPI0026239101|nr:hypothetical protein [uncultured Rhodospira sp.]
MASAPKKRNDTSERIPTAAQERLDAQMEREWSAMIEGDREDTRALIDSTPSQAGRFGTLERDALVARLRAKGRDAADTMLSETTYLSGEDFAARIGLTRQALDKRRKAGTVLGLQGEKRGVRYPVWQLENSEGQPVYVLPALKETLPALLESLGGPWSVHTFLTTSWPQVGGRTGLDLLREGAGAEALELARSTRYGGGP